MHAFPRFVAIFLSVCLVAVSAAFAKPPIKKLTHDPLVPAVVALAIALRFGSGPLDDTLSARPVANELAQFDPHHLPVAVFLIPRETEFGLAFYRDQVPFRYESGQVPDGEHMVVVAKRYSRGVNKAAGRKAVYLGEFAPQKLDYFYVPGR